MNELQNKLLSGKMKAYRYWLGTEFLGMKNSSPL